ncbi:MAG: right-handed parallel beta-helix repeat-containing protein [Phycisphaerales bacterium]|nr:right-handed parallel beta-helix repeat-containing protein [Phycisphaerales bacterium]
MRNNRISYGIIACVLGVLVLQLAVATSVRGEQKALNDQAIESQLKAIGQTHKTLVLETGRWTIQKSVRIPANVNLKLEYGAELELGEGVTFTIDGPMEAVGIGRIFYGKGNVRFGPGYLKEVYPQWWGQIEGKDDTDTCQAALDSGAGTIRFVKGTYAIDAVGGGAEAGRGLYPKSDTTLLFDSGAVLQAIATDKNDYTIVNIRGQKNVTLDGATIRGERNDHKGKGGEWGHGLRIVGGSTNVTIRNVTVSDCWGDGIYLGEGTVDGVLVEDSTFDNNRRNACSITNARNVLFRHCTFSNTNGTSPFKGVDLEPNVEADKLQNITFENCRSYRNLSGGYSVARDDKQNDPVSVTFRGCISEEDGMGFGIDIGPSDCAGLYTISNCTVINPKEDGFRATSANLQIRIDGLYIFNPNRKGESRAMFGSGFVVLCYAPHHAGKFKWTGNIDARDVYVISDDDKPHYALYFENIIPDKSGIENLDIELKTNLPANKRFFKGLGPYRGYCKVNFADDPVVDAKGDISEAEMAGYIAQTITNRGADKDITLSLNDPRSGLLDSVYTIEVVEAHKITLDLGGMMLLPGNLKRYESGTPGSRLTIKSDGKRWHVLEQVGTWK